MVHSSDEAIQQLRHLDWTVETKLAKVNARGKVVANLGAKRRRVGSIQGSRIDEFLHRVSGRPAFYRVDISFYRIGTGRLLGAYSSYARVVRPKVDIRIVAETPTVLPGGLATANLVNLGTGAIQSAAYDYGFSLEAFTGERWIPVPENPQRGRVPKRMQILPAGAENRGCLRYLVPINQAPGLFRFVAHGTSGELLAAEFEVVAGPLPR